MFTLQIQCDSIEHAERVLAALKHTAEPAVVQQVAAQVAPNDTGKTDQAPARRGRPPKEKPAASAESPVRDTTTVTGSAEKHAVPEQQAPTLDTIRAALQGVQKKYGADDMAKPIAILQKFGAGRISEVKAEDYSAFIAACEAA